MSFLKNVKKSGTNPKADPMAVIVVTDIGADIDDTLALFALLGASEQVKIVAYVTTVNNGILRGELARGYMRTLGVYDDDIEILPSANGVPHGCHVSKSFATPENSALGEIEKTPKRIVEICETYKEKGVLIYGIASLDPVAKALKEDKQGVMLQAVRGLYLQGNVKVNAEGVDPMVDSNTVVTNGRKHKPVYDEKLDEKLFPKVTPSLVKGKYETEHPIFLEHKNCTLKPAFDAQNFKMAKKAAELVFETFQDRVPIVTVGKYAAYKIPITVKNFLDWSEFLRNTWSKEIVTERAEEWYTQVEEDRKAEGKEGEPVPKVPSPDLYEMVKSQMKSFYASNKGFFRNIYDVPDPIEQGKEGKESKEGKGGKESKESKEGKGGENANTYINGEGERKAFATDFSEEDISEFGWWLKYPDLIVCRPYDPLLALKMILDIKTMQNSRGGGIGGDDPEGDTAADYFDEFKVQPKKGHHHHHTLIGNSRACHSVESEKVVAIAQVLNEYIARGLQQRPVEEGRVLKPLEQEYREFETMPVVEWTVNDVVKRTDESSTTKV